MRRFWPRLLLPLLLLLAVSAWMQANMLATPKRDVSTQWSDLLSPVSAAAGLEAWLSPVALAPRKLREGVITPGVGLRSVAFSPDGHRALAVGEGGTVLVSTDGGLSWAAQTSGSGVDLMSVAFSPDGQRALAVGDGGTVLVSTNGGLSWAAQTSGSVVALRSVAYSPDGQRALAVASDGTVLLSTDAGRSWAEQTSGTGQPLTSVAFSPDGQRALAVGGFGAVLLSTDGGRSWTAQTSVGRSRSLVAVAFSAHGQRALGVGFGGTVLSSTDGGVSWTAQPTGSRQFLAGVAFGSDGQRALAVGNGGTVLLSTDGGESWAAYASGSGFDLSHVAVSPDGQRALAVGDGGTVVLSTDGGKSWAAQTIGSSQDLLSVAFSPDGQRAVAVGVGGTVLRSTDGGQSWAAHTSGSVKGLTSVAFSPNGRRALAVGDGGTILLSTDSGESWASQNSGSVKGLASVTFSPDGQRALAVGVQGTVLLSTDGGASWAAQNSGSDRFLFTSVAISPDGQHALAVGSSGAVLLSTDGGESWAVQRSGSGQDLAGVAFNPDGQRVAAVGSGGTVLLSSDGGRSWAAQTIGNGRDLTSVAFSPDGGRALAVGKGGAVLMSTDGGQSLALPTVGSGRSLRSVAFSPDGRRTLAVGLGGTLLLSIDGGQSWTAQTSGSGPDLMGVAFSPDGQRALAVGGRGMVLLGTNGGQSWATQTSGSGQDLASVAFSPDGQRALAVGASGTVALSTDGGKSWATQSRGGGKDLTSVAFSTGGQRALAVGEGGTVLLSTDGGESWVAQNSGSGRGLSAVTFSPDGQRALAVGVRGTLLLSTDSGRSWAVPTSAKGQNLLWGVAFSPNGQRALAVGIGGTVLLSTDSGESWSAQTSGSAQGLTSVAFSPDGQRALAVGIGGTVLLSTDGGESWTTQTSSSAQALTSVAISPDDQRALAVGTDSVVAISVGPAFNSWSIRFAIPRPPTVDPRPGVTPLQLPSPAAMLAATLILAWLAQILVQASARPELLQHDAEGGVHDNPIDRLSEDRLGTGNLARAIVRLLSSLDTKPPLALAICAPWGSGKSSVLRMLQRELQRHGSVPVWFNAWHYQTDTELLAALIEHVRDQMPRSLMSWRAVRCKASLIYQRLLRHHAVLSLLVFATVLGLAQWELASWGQVGDRVCQAVMALEQDFTGTAGANTGASPAACQAFANAVQAAKVVGTPLVAVVVLMGLWATWRRGPFTSSLVRMASAVGHRVADASGLRSAVSEAGFRYRFQKEFGEVCRALGKGRLVLIIDDLDRCEPPQVERLIATLNFLFNASSDCHAVLGMDWAYVRTAVGLSYKDISAELQTSGTGSAEQRARFGEAFLRKVVQLRVDVQVQDGSNTTLAGAAMNARAWGPLLPRLPFWIWWRRFLKRSFAVWRNRGRLPSSKVIRLDAWKGALIRTFRAVLEWVADRRPWPVFGWCALAIGLFALMANLEQFASAKPDIGGSVSSLPEGPSAQGVLPPIVEFPDRDGQGRAGGSVVVVPPDENRVPSGIGWLPLIGALAVLSIWRAWVRNLVRDSMAFRQALQRWRTPLRDVVDTPREWRRFQNRCRFAAMHLRVLCGERLGWLASRRWARVRRWAWTAGAPSGEMDVSSAEGDLVDLVAWATKQGPDARQRIEAGQAVLNRRLGDGAGIDDVESAGRALVRCLYEGTEVELRGVLGRELDEEEGEADGESWLLEGLSTWLETSPTDELTWQRTRPNGALRGLDALAVRECLLALNLRSMPLVEPTAGRVQRLLESRLRLLIAAAVLESTLLVHSEQGRERSGATGTAQEIPA